MAMPSILLQQHIGTIERWESHIQNSTYGKRLKDKGGIFQPGFTVFFPRYPCLFKPEGLEVEFQKLSAAYADEVATIQMYYYLLLQNLDPVLLENSKELPARQEELKQALIEEAVLNGDEVWYRNMSGVWKIRITGFEGKRATFVMLNNFNTESSAVFNRMRFYSSYEAALNDEGGGYYVKR